MVGTGKRLGAEEKGLWRQQAPDVGPTPATSCVTLGKSFNLSGPPLVIIKTQGFDLFLVDLLCGLNEIILQCLLKCLSYCRPSFLLGPFLQY